MLEDRFANEYDVPELDTSQVYIPTHPPSPPRPPHKHTHADPRSTVTIDAYMYVILDTHTFGPHS